MDEASPVRNLSASGKPLFSRRPAAGGRRCPRATAGAAVRRAMLLLLVLGLLVRPLFILTCDLHATLFAHSGQPHEHVHDDGTQDNDAHGDHQQGQSGAGSGAADVPPTLALTLPPRARFLVPVAGAGRLVERVAGVPFRPPIG